MLKDNIEVKDLDLIMFEKDFEDFVDLYELKLNARLIEEKLWDLTNTEGE